VISIIAFLGYPDGKYHIPGSGLEQVTTFLFSRRKALIGFLCPKSKAFSYTGKWNTIQGAFHFQGIRATEAE
jgi:hypothetical protein